jgi:gas vesicle protein
MSISEFLGMEVGATLAFVATWIVAGFAYKKNQQEHEKLGDKVDASLDKVTQSIKKLEDKIDSVREIISQHETHWHAPIARKTTPIKRVAKKR